MRGNYPSLTFSVGWTSKRPALTFLFRYLASESIFAKNHKYLMDDKLVIVYQLTPLKDCQAISMQLRTEEHEATSSKATTNTPHSYLNLIRNDDFKLKSKAGKNVLLTLALSFSHEEFTDQQGTAFSCEVRMKTSVIRRPMSTVLQPWRKHGYRMWQIFRIEAPLAQPSSSFYSNAGSATTKIVEILDQEAPINR